jgi:general stress protein CsbA
LRGHRPFFDRLRLERQFFLFNCRLIVSFHVGTDTRFIALSIFLVKLVASYHAFLLSLVIDGVSFIRRVAGPQHDFLFPVLALLHSSKSRSLVFEVIEGILLRRLFYFFCKLELRQKFAVIGFCIVGRPFCLPGGSLVDVVVLGVVPSFGPGLWLPLFESL